MDLDRAVEIVKYGIHARPKMANEAERREALRIVLNHPETWEELLWSHKY